MGSAGGSSSSAKPLKPAQVQGYYNQLNTDTGGRLADFALNGTQPTAYTPLGDAGRVTAPTANASTYNYQPVDYRSALNAPSVAPAAQVDFRGVNAQVSAPQATASLAAYTPYDYSSLLQQPRVGAAAQAALTPVAAPAAVAAPTAATREVGYQELTPEQAMAVGGLGALREQQARRSNAQTLAQYAADPGLSTFQHLRANQLENQDFGSTLDALNQEREAAIVQFMADQRAKTLQANLANQSEVNKGAQFNATQKGAADQFNVSRALEASLANQGNAQAVGISNAGERNAMAQLAAKLGMDYQTLMGNLTSTEQGRGLQVALANQNASNQNSQFNATQQAAANQLNVGTQLSNAQMGLQASLANQAATNSASQLASQLGLSYEQLIGGLTSTDQGRVLQAGQANQQALNQTSQFNAVQQAAADQFNVGTQSTDAQRTYMANLANAGLSSSDMQALARIFFGGMGNTQTQQTPMFGGSDVVNAATLGALATGLVTI